MTKSELSTISFQVRARNRFTKPKSNDFAKSCVREARIFSGTSTSIMANTMTAKNSIIRIMAKRRGNRWRSFHRPEESPPTNIAGIIRTQDQRHHHEC